MDRSEIRRIQEKRLRQTVAWAYERVPFYRRKLEERGLTPEDIRGLDDLQRLPFTTKDELRTLYPYGALAVPTSEIVEIHATSGTTGTPTLGFYTSNDIEAWAEVAARSLTMAGIAKDDVFQITPSFGMFTGGFGFYHGARKIGAMIIPTGAGFSRRQIQYMIDFGTTAVCAVVSYILRLTETAREMGIDPARDTKVRKGIFGSEMWTTEMKKKISQIWDMDVYDIYGFTELCGPGVANDCYIHDGLHVWEDHFLVEVVDPRTGEVLEPEERGELVFTTLTKEAAPLLRYRCRDISYIYDAAVCECGRTHRRLGWISGRIDDMIKVSGVSVWPSQVESVLLQHPEVGQEYQIIVTRQEGLDRLKIVVESRHKLEKHEADRMALKLAKNLRDALMTSVEVSVVDPMSLPRQEVGKAKRVIDERGV